MHTSEEAQTTTSMRRIRCSALNISREVSHSTSLEAEETRIKVRKVAPP